MNLHPIFVHFPIALLTVYALFELVRFRKIVEKPYWWSVKKVFVVVGSASSLLAAFSGLWSTSWHIQGPRIFVMHEIFALTTIILSIIASIYYLKNKPSRILLLIAALILVSVTITGGLGGAMTNGTDFDPFMAPIFKLLGV